MQNRHNSLKANRVVSGPRNAFLPGGAARFASTPGNRWSPFVGAGDAPAFDPGKSAVVEDCFRETGSGGHVSLLSGPVALVEATLARASTMTAEAFHQSGPFSALARAKPSTSRQRF